jgi:hypothetical protein
MGNHTIFFLFHDKFFHSLIPICHIFSHSFPMGIMTWKP